MPPSLHNRLETQADAVLYFIHRMDVEMVDKLLDDQILYGEVEKRVFIDRLACAFEQFAFKGDTCLNYFSGYCNYQPCNFMCKGQRFIGNVSGFFLDLIIEAKNGRITDVYDCTGFECLEKDVMVVKQLYLDESFGDDPTEDWDDDPEF